PEGKWSRAPGSGDGPRGGEPVELPAVRQVDLGDEEVVVGRQVEGIREGNVELNLLPSQWSVAPGRLQRARVYPARLHGVEGREGRGQHDRAEHQRIR